MEKKQKLVQYREFFDKTLASPDLTNNEMLKKLVESQLEVERIEKVDTRERKQCLQRAPCGDGDWLRRAPALRKGSSRWRPRWRKRGLGLG
ncbi:hypothetical protein S83_065714, partial [Arachis hypogaea]